MPPCAGTYEFAIKHLNLQRVRSVSRIEDCYQSSTNFGASEENVAVQLFVRSVFFIRYMSVVLFVCFFFFLFFFSVLDLICKGWIIEVTEAITI